MGMEPVHGDLSPLFFPSPRPVRSVSESKMIVIAGYSSGDMKVVVGMGEQRRTGGK